MLTNLAIQNFKLFDDVEVELGDRVVLIGPNNAGKTSALQALALWDIGVKRWAEKRGTGKVPKKRPGVTINRRDLIAVPIPEAKLLWRDLHVREGAKENGKSGTKNVLIQVVVEGVNQGKTWSCGLEFDYANPESFYCRPLRHRDGEPMEVPQDAVGLRLAYLPPMSGLAANERRHDKGAINVLLGEGRTDEVLRNLCWQVFQDENDSEKKKWAQIVKKMKLYFGIDLDPPEYVKERGEITMTYREKNGVVRLDLSSSGRGQQQTLLLLAHMTVNPGSILLLDEPDAHLEILRQRHIYQVLTDIAKDTGSQIIAASHSEVILNEAADRDVVIAFVGKPHRIDDRGVQALKALKEFGFEHYYQAEETGWALYLEGATDLAILKAFAKRLSHDAQEYLERPFVHYVCNQPQKARAHFYALREAKPDFVGIALYDRLDTPLPKGHGLDEQMWRKQEIENYLCMKDVLLSYAEEQGRAQHGDLFASTWRQAMDDVIQEAEKALETLEAPSPWGDDIKVTDKFLDPVFAKFYKKLDLPNMMRKTNYHMLAPFVSLDMISEEVAEKLDAIYQAAQMAKPST